MSGPVLVDTDPGIDDALAFHYLGATDGWDLKAITVVAGNTFVATLDAQATLQ
jgi:inosine-uridine nucleoside N-ribohydrolase